MWALIWLERLRFYFNGEKNSIFKRSRKINLKDGLLKEMN